MEAGVKAGGCVGDGGQIYEGPRAKLDLPEHMHHPIGLPVSPRRYRRSSNLCQGDVGCANTVLKYIYTYLHRKDPVLNYIKR